MSNAEATIRELVTTRKVVLFMKGSRHFPQCGFSAQVVEILNKLVPSYETVNVLADPEMRDAIKRFSTGRRFRSSTWTGSSSAAATS